MNKEEIDIFNYQMETVGYYVYENFISDNLCDIFKKNIAFELENYQSYNTERSKLDQYHLHNLLCKYLPIAKLLEDKRLDLLLSQLLGEHWIMYAFTSSSCPPMSTNYGGRIHVDSPRWINNYSTNIGILWALDDFTIENGATHVLPGSHHSKNIPPHDHFKENSIQVKCNKGSLVIFNARVVHSTGFNTTEKWRHALTMNACRSYMKQRMDWVRFIPNNISDNLNPLARRIIGFDTRLPTNLDEFFLPEEERFYKANQG